MWTRKPDAESNDLVLSVLAVSVVAQPAKKMMLAAEMRIRLELVILFFIVRCGLTAYDLVVESASRAGVNRISRLSQKCNNRAGIANSAIAISCGGLGDAGDTTSMSSESIGAVTRCNPGPIAWTNSG